MEYKFKLKITPISAIIKQDSDQMPKACITGQLQKVQKRVILHCTTIQTRWQYCLECPQYSIQLKAVSYLCTSCLLPAFDDA